MRNAILPIAAAIVFTAGAWGSVDPSTFDTAAKPQDDFFQFANGGWVKAHPIPPEYSRWGSFETLAVRNQENLATICREVAAKADATPVERMVGDFFASGMDEAALNAAGFRPIQPELDRVAALKDAGDVMAEIAHLHSIGVRAGFAFYSSADPENSAVEIAHLRQGGLSLPTRDYYVNDDERSKTIRKQFVEHVARMMVLVGETPDAAAEHARTVLHLETVLAQAQLTPEVLRNPYASYHKMAVSKLPAFTEDIDWPSYFWQAGAPYFSEVNFAHPTFFKVFDEVLVSAPVSDWQAYLRWHLVHHFAPYLSDAFVAEDFSFFGHTLVGTEKMLPRWKKVVTEIDGDVGEALGQLYVARYFPPEAKARVLKLVGDLRAALHRDLETLAWMDDTTRARAIAKLDAFTVKMGYPDTWRDYSGLVIDRGPYVLNVMRADAFDWNRNMAKIGKPVDTAEWHMTPPTVNAYYNPTRNEIVFPAGILQPPFFSKDADDASNYGGIGAVIGHEMTHGFDDMGRQYDAKGNLKDWWTPESAARFKQRSSGIVKQFSSYTVLDGLHLIGERTQGENIADLGGIKIAYAALEKALEGKARDPIDGFTPEQRFFISYASNWCMSIRPEALRMRVKSDPHSPAQFRCNGPLSNLEEFYKAFDVPEGAPMRRPADQRVTIW
jgi:putative endopeptidase